MFEIFRHILDLTTAANMENIIITDATLSATTICGPKVVFAQFLKFSSLVRGKLRTMETFAFIDSTFLLYAD